MVRAGLVRYFTNLILQNKTSSIDPVAYANIPWNIAHLSLESAYDENDSPETRMKILKNVTCLNRGLLGFLIGKLNSFTY
jgi:hypothetical protein